METPIPEVLLDILQDLGEKDLKLFWWHLINGVEGFRHLPKAQLENADRQDTVDKMVQSYEHSGAVEITLVILKKINQNQLAEDLRTRLKACRDRCHEVAVKSPAPSPTAAQDRAIGSAITAADSVQSVLRECRRSLEETYECIFEGMARERKTALENIYTEVYIIEGETKVIHGKDEIWPTEQKCRAQFSRDSAVTLNNIFTPLLTYESNEERKGRKIRTVLTKGIAGIGKTVAVQKFMLDWAKGIANPDIDFIFWFPFRELNLIKDDIYSLYKLMIYFYPELETVTEAFVKRLKLVFILDGLDESQFALNFVCKNVSDTTKETRINEILVNLIKGKLLPNANVWITSRPAAASQIPFEYFHRVTEIQGFSDAQKEEYFRRRISDQEKANIIISHIKQSKTLHSMCYIPVFCQVSATVLKQMFHQSKKEIPKSLTEMYVLLLLIQTDIKQQKYENSMERDSKKLLESNRTLILKMAQLAFRQLIRGNVMFYEEDLRECSIDVTEASVNSGICTEIFKVESGLYQRKVYCFVHLSFQEFLAALYVFYCYVCKKMEVLKFFLHDSYEHGDSEFSGSLSQSINAPLEQLLVGAVDKALRSENGHLDLFLRFLLGISQESNQRLLQGLLIHKQSSSESIEKTIRYIKKLFKGYKYEEYAEEYRRHCISTDKSINLFLCLSELNDQSLAREIHEYLKSGTRLEEKLSAAQCSAIAYMLQSSEEALDEFNLKKYNTSIEGYRRLIPALSNCRKAILAGCNLTINFCELLALALQSANSCLKELDLSNNDLQDSGVGLLVAGLKCSHCNLEVLRLARCNLTVESCKSLTSALQSENSSLMELDLSNNDLEDSGVDMLANALKSLQCKLKILRLVFCNLGEQVCENLGSVLQQENSSLKELDLSNNDLQDSGVKLIAAGLKSSYCKLEILKLSGCLVTERGCSFLSSALTSHSSHLKELDLTYNYPGESGVKLLSAKLEDPHCKLETLRVEHGEIIRIKPGLNKYACELTLDPNTAHTSLTLCEGNRRVVCVKEQQSYPDHPERFADLQQVLCRESLTGRCYWEAEWNGLSAIAVSYKTISRKGSSEDCVLGSNEKSWSLYYINDSYLIRHNGKDVVIPAPSSSSNRVGIYVDCPAGSLTFYSISSDSLTHLHTLQSNFTEPLYAGFWVSHDSSACVSFHEKSAI
ncbi:NACHT, LRR and PYD domains-containing protein 12-like isoform X2 [Colossoma macropomum]|uniref:NACHT, LRR and PYD domains-containing protein 12-like isoform X2 n=1 Tax=Colossoma macropomum TaxID=42526 RepID=UPI0018646BAB|nr:NACHT, LRR and PYD domains-containing protein 12-like isoform X2 [Colossoma macropomum]